MNLSAEDLFRSLVSSGFSHVVGAQLPEIAEYLENQAANRGTSTPLFLSEAIRAMYALFAEHNESGGIRTGFVDDLSALVRERLSVIEGSDPAWAAKLAQDFRDEVREKVASYDPRNTYE